MRLSIFLEVYLAKAGLIEDIQIFSTNAKLTKATSARKARLCCLFRIKLCFQNKIDGTKILSPITL